MKTSSLIWGIVLLFIGGVLLLDNLNLIDFYWRSIWRFWPVFLIIAGINVLFSKTESKLAGGVSIGILVLVLALVFYKGQQKPVNSIWHDDNNKSLEFNDDEEDSKESKSSYAKPFIAADSLKKTVLNIYGGGTSFDLKDETDSLIVTEFTKKNSRFTLKQEITDSVNTLIFKANNKNGKNSWSFNGSGGDVDLFLNTCPTWEINLKVGASAIDFDLTKYKIRTFNFNGGAASLDIKIGDLLPITDVNVKSGVAEVKIAIPETSGCRITTKTGLSSKDFEGFTNLGDGVYQTPNYKTASKKIFIILDGGLSSFEVSKF